MAVDPTTMFAGEYRDYHDVRQLVIATYGPLDQLSEFSFLTFLGNMQQAMWADIRRHPWYLAEWTVTPADPGGFLIPDDVAMICSAVGTTEGAGDDPDTVVTYELHRAGCTSSEVDPHLRNLVGYGCGSSAPVRAQVGASAIVPDDEPTSIKITGYRSPVRTFFTVEEQEDDSFCRVWREIDLPAEYRNVYAKGVVGMMFFGGGDAQRGADWLNLANGEFSDLKRANPGLISGTPTERGMFLMGSRHYMAPTSCCQLGENWRFSV